jgi:hypothetical protein
MDISMLPILAAALLLTVFAVLEIRSFRARLSEGQLGDGTFVPPPNGYSYYVSTQQVVFIRPSGWHRFRIYPAYGPAPDITLRQDRYGTYFAARSRDTAAVETLIDSLYGV